MRSSHSVCDVDYCDASTVFTLAFMKLSSFCTTPWLLLLCSSTSIRNQANASAGVRKFIENARHPPFCPFVDQQRSVVRILQRHALAISRDSCDENHLKWCDAPAQAIRFFQIEFDGNLEFYILFLATDDEF